MKIFLKGSRCFFVFFIANILSFYKTQAQIPATDIVNTEPIELYLQLANSIKQNGKPDDLILKEYFNNPNVAFFNQRPGFDSLKFVNDLISVNSNRNGLGTAVPDEDCLLMEKYRQNEEAIKRSVSYLKTVDIGRMVRKRLRPVLPVNFHLDRITIQYQYLFLEEGTGGIPGKVFNSALQTAYLPDDIIDVIAAHEAYHTIANTIFIEKFGHVSQSPSLSEYEKNLLWYLEIVAEEGIADLIDKPVLAASRTPLQVEYHQLSQNENHRATQKIHLLDSLLIVRTGKNEQAFEANILLENGGHIPGRYMAQYIKNNNFKDYLNYTGNPFQFFFHYNDAVRNKTGLPILSERAIAYLKEVEQRFTQKN